ncbi:MAG: gamma-glutamylcyclotransferase [Rhodovarius sp.]|nr:gamma-glutamylcyclotransferase [Rhodovarius sp.]MDW8315202.1 gamma-glutamylcyclotransferase [Rhodovarius sp.]
MFVFAYGSLIWRPGFPYLAAHPAILRGYHRRFCLWSRHYRGTPESPGLVLGLDRGGSCHGIAFEVAEGEAEAVLDYLDRRENPLGEAVYHRRLLPVTLRDGRRVAAFAYVADRTHPAYARPGLEAAAEAIARGHGQAGSNRDYLFNTLRHLRAHGLRDRGLERLAAQLSAAGPAAGHD